MLILLSPAKRLDYDSPIPAAIAASADSTASITTQAQFLPQASALIALLRQHPPQAIASLMHLSDALAALNVARYHTWTADNAAGTARRPHRWGSRCRAQRAGAQAAQWGAR